MCNILIIPLYSMKLVKKKMRNEAEQEVNYSTAKLNVIKGALSFIRPPISVAVSVGQEKLKVICLSNQNKNNCR